RLFAVDLVGAPEVCLRPREVEGLRGVGRGEQRAEGKMAASAAGVEHEETFERVAGLGRVSALPLALAEVVEAVLVAWVEGERLLVARRRRFEVAGDPPLGRRVVLVPEREDLRLLARGVGAKRVGPA